MKKQTPGWTGTQGSNGITVESWEANQVEKKWHDMDHVHYAIDCRSLQKPQLFAWEVCTRTKANIVHG